MSISVLILKNQKPVTDAKVAIYTKSFFSDKFKMRHTGSGNYVSSDYSKPIGELFVNGKSYGVVSHGAVINI